MQNMRKGFGKYGFILVFLIAMIVCCMKKDSYLQTAIVSYPDSQIELQMGHLLEQTWQPHVKKITGVSVPYTALDSYDGNFKLEILTDDRAEVLATAVVEKQFAREERGSIDFSFDTLKVTLGERYRIQVSFESEAKEAGILIDSGTNYMGCSVDGQESNEAAAFKITFIKNSRLFWLFAILFPLVSFSFLFMVLWERKWEEVITLSAIVSIFPMYLLGLFEHLTGGIAATYILAAVSFVVAVYLYSKKEYDWKGLVSPGLLIWGIVVIAILISCQDIWLARWDEYSHWGLAVKDMFYYDSFAKHYDTTVLAQRYLPFSTLVEYLYIYLNGLFSEDIIYVAFQIMILNGIIIISHMLKKKWAYTFPVLATMFFVPMIFFEDVSSCVYVDPMLAVFAAFVMICYFGEETSLFNWIRIFAGLFALVTTKDMGFVIAGLLTLVMIADILYKQWNNKKLEIRKLVVPAISVVSVILSFLSWQIYLSIPYEIPQNQQEVVTNTAVSSIEASKLSIDGILNFFTSNGESYQYVSVKSYLIKLFDGEAYFIGNVGVSCMDIAIVLLVLTIVLGYVGAWGKWKHTMFSFGCFSFVGYLVYCGFLELLYIFTFSEQEALTSASYERYIASFLCANVLVFLYLLLRRLAEGTKDNKKCYAVAISLAAVIIMAVPFNNFIYTNREKSISENMKYGFNEMEEVLRSFSKRGEKTYFVCSNSNGGSYFMFRTSASPVHVPYRQVNLAASEESAQIQKEIFASREMEMKEKTILSVEQWSERLEECDYVFVMVTDEMFEKDYGVVFEDAETIDNGTFYKVAKEDGKIILKYIGQVPVKGYF